MVQIRQTKKYTSACILLINFSHIQYGLVKLEGKKIIPQLPVNIWNIQKETLHMTAYRVTNNLSQTARAYQIFMTCSKSCGRLYRIISYQIFMTCSNTCGRLYRVISYQIFMTCSSTCGRLYRTISSASSRCFIFTSSPMISFISHSWRYF